MRKSYLIGFAIGLMAAPALADNYASQLELENCGGYSLYMIEALAKVSTKDKNEEWKRVGCWGNCDRGESSNARIYNGDSICFGLSDINTANKTYTVVKLRAKIAGGDIKSTDHTNFDAGSGKRRVFRMEGTEEHNNRPYSRKYTTTLSDSKCDPSGQKNKQSVNCIW